MGTQGGVLLGVLPDFISMGHSSPGFAPSGEVLSLACPRESTQRERHPDPSSAGADALCSSPNRASRATRSLKQGALLLPGLAAVLGEGYGIRGSILKTRRRSRASQPVWDRASRPVELDLLAVRRGKSCQFGERPNRREAQGTRASGQAFGAAFLLVPFLWRSEEKELAVKAKPDA